jgi:hypothetical protein
MARHLAEAAWWVLTKQEVIAGRRARVNGHFLRHLTPGASTPPDVSWIVTQSAPIFFRT